MMKTPGKLNHNEVFEELGGDLRGSPPRTGAISHIPTPDRAPARCLSWRGPPACNPTYTRKAKVGYTPLVHQTRSSVPPAQLVFCIKPHLSNVTPTMSLATLSRSRPSSMAIYVLLPCCTLSISGMQLLYHD